MSRWADAAEWFGEGLRREVFYFDSGAQPLYGSLYVAAEPSQALGLVACSSWGTEADRSEPLVRSVAIRMALLGGAGMVFHYPGYGDSYGDLASVGLEDLTAAARDALGEASRRCAGFSWIFAGFMLGASVASLAHREADVESLLLVQPELRPGSYFHRLGRRREGLPVGGGGERIAAGEAEGTAYGYPLPSRIVADPDKADAAVVSALGAFEGGGAEVRHLEPDREGPSLPGVVRVDVPGRWRFGARSSPGLSEAACEWLERYVVGEG